MLLIAMGLLALSASATTSQALAGEYEYVYVDDFTTDKVTTDSYEHSQILYYDPGYSFYGMLVLWPWPTYEPCLGFWPGFEFGASVLRYQFPIVPITGNITGGTVGLDIELLEPFSGFWLDVKVSYDGENWEALDHITTPGYYEYPLSPPDSISQVYLEFWGGMMVLYNLSVQLNMTDVEFICGDINGDWNEPNIADVTYFVDYLFGGGPPPPIMENADVDGSGGNPNVADLTYLVNYFFFGGPAPDCP
jgi:hypothetical protein